MDIQDMGWGIWTKVNEAMPTFHVYLGSKGSIQTPALR